jgi:CHASE2 domain-containing sensor protein
LALSSLACSALHCIRNTSSYIWTAVLVLGLAFINPFGSRQAAEDESRNVFFSIIAPFYPASAQKLITVVIVDDEALAKAKETFPPSFAYYDRLLANIAAYQPKAIFLDFLLADPRGNPADLDRLAANISQLAAAKNIPVLMPVLLEAERGNGAVAKPDVQQTLPALRQVAQPVHVELLEQGARIEPIINAAAPATHYNAASLGLYRIYAQSSGIPLDDHAFRDELVVQWGENVSADNIFLVSEKGCATGASPLFRAAKRLWWEFFPAAGRGALQRLHNCSSHTTVRSDLVHRIGLLRAETARNGHADPDGFARELFADRYVFIGAEFSGQNDYGLSPVYGRQTGVHIHAMAFDNLVVYGSDYFHPWPKVLTVGADSILEAVLVLFSGWLAATWARRSRHQPPTLRAGLCFALIGLAVPLLVLTYSTMVLRFEPVNWIGLLTIGLMFNARLFKDLILTAFSDPIRTGAAHAE